MSKSELKILQVSTSDRGGGAEGSARNLFLAFRRRGHASWLAVGAKSGDDEDVFEIPRRPDGPLWSRPVQWLAARVRARGGGGAGRRLARCLERLANPSRLRDWWLGREEFQFPGCRDLLDLTPARPDLVHCHNLHGWYFDLTVLPELSHRVPVILNLRDAWLLTGHGAYPMDCSRWENGCGRCPDLKRYPGIRADATAVNWERKRDIYARSRLYVTAPSQWLLDMARRSMLQAVEYRLIPNGIDTDVFRPGERAAARRRLGMPENRRIVLFVSASARNVYKDPGTMQSTVAKLMADPAHGDVLAVCLGARPDVQFASREALLRVPFQADPGVVADHYRAADVFIHTARAEAFGKTVTEAMACGTPVVASAVGGLVEQIEDGVSGILAPAGDAAGMAAAVSRLLRDPDRRQAMGAVAAAQAERYSLDRQATSFLDWYREILAAAGTER